MNKVFSIWKGIVSKKSLNAIKEYINLLDEYTYSDTEALLTILSDKHISIVDTQFPKLFKQYKLESYIIYY